MALLLATASSPAQNVGEHWVDGLRGRDVPGAGTRSDPWRTITYAVARIPAVTDAAQWRSLFVEGGQVYAPATNGETLPIRPAYNLWIEGRPAGNQLPVIRATAGATALRYDPTVVYSRNQSTLRSLVFEGGDYGIAMGQSNDNRHRPRIEDCVFRGQSLACVRIDDAGPARGIDPRFFRCTFATARYGMEISAANPGAVVFPDVEECTFRELREYAIRLDDVSTGGNVGATFRGNQVVACTNGIWVNSHTQPTATQIRILDSSFQDVPDYAVVVVVNGPAAAAAHIERTAFLRCETGVTLAGNPTGGRCDLTLAESVAYACTSVGLRVELRGRGTCSVTTRDNLFERCAGAGASFDIATTDVAFRLHSLRDRFLRNRSGLLLARCREPDAVRIESAMICGQTSAGIQSLWPFTARSLTLADNGYGVAVLLQGNAATLDHCVFAGNAMNVLGAPAITWSCFQGSSFAGTGNLNQTDPLLVRPLYKLAANSPCIDRGNLSLPLPATDYEGDPRASVGRRGGTRLPDIGADEYVVSGSARRYGTPGFGAFNFFPRIGSPNHEVVVGRPLTIALSGAILPVSGVPAQHAFLTVGTRDDSGPLPFDLSVIDAPGSLLWNEFHTVVGFLPVTSLGTATMVVAIPDSPLLVGQSLAWQWFASHPASAARAQVASDALRVTIGQ